MKRKRKKDSNRDSKFPRYTLMRAQEHDFWYVHRHHGAQECKNKIEQPALSI